MQPIRRSSFLRILLFLLLFPVLFVLADTLLFFLWNFGSPNSRQALDAVIDAAGRSPSALPRRVHQIWIGAKDPPPRYAACAKSWRDLASTKDYSYTLWNATSIEALLSQHFPSFVSMWKGYRYDMNRVDSAKYFLLFFFGGIYSDMDICNTLPDPVQLLSSEKYLAQRPPKHVLLVKGLPVGVNPEFMAAIPGSPFFAHLLRNLYDANRYFPIPYLYMMCVGGPCFLTGAYLRYSAPEQIMVLQYDQTRGRIFGVVRGGEWYTLDADLLIRVFYLGIVRGEIVPNWLTMVLLLVLIAICCGCLWRAGQVRRRRAVCQR